MLIGLQIHRAIHDIEEIHHRYEADTAKMRNDVANMPVSPTYSSTLRHCTVIHHSTDVLSLDCCPIFTSLYPMCCIEIATIGIVVYLNYKKLQHE